MKHIGKQLVGIICMASMVVSMLSGIGCVKNVKAAEIYKAYMFFQMDNYAFRDEWDNKDYGINSGAIQYSSQLGYWSASLQTLDANITDTVIQKDNIEYSVKISGTNLRKLSEGYSNASYFKMLGISTDIPLTVHGVTAKATLSIDGVTVVQNVEAPHKGDDKHYYRFMISDDYASGDGTGSGLAYGPSKKLTIIPKESIEIRFTLSGLNTSDDTVASQAPVTTSNAPVTTSNAPVVSQAPVTSQDESEQSGIYTKNQTKKIYLRNKKITIRVGESFQLCLKNAEKYDVDWHSENKKIAYVYVDGEVEGDKAGKTKIIAKYKGKKYVCKVTVKKKKKIKTGRMAISKKNMTMKNSDRKTIRIKNPKKTVKWKINTEKYGHIDTYGRENSICEIYTDNNGNNGSFIVTASVGKRKFRCKITVKGIGENVSDNSTTSPTTPDEKYTIAFNKLKQYIKNNGQTNNNGDKFIKRSSNESDSSYQAGIVYQSKEDSLKFIMAGAVIVDNGKAQTNSTMTLTKYNESKVAVSTATTVWGDSYSSSFTGETSIQKDTYTHDTYMNITITSNSGSVTSSILTKEKDVCRSYIKLSFSMWALLLLENGYSLADLGFTAYGYQS